MDTPAPAAATQRAAAVTEISLSAQFAAKRTANMSGNLGRVRAGTESARDAAARVQEDAGALGERAGMPRGDVMRCIGQVQAVSPLRRPASPERS